jgi:purine-binding chemotaxis protein CheW
MTVAAPSATLNDRGLATSGPVTSEHQYVSFRINGELFGVPVRLVQEVLNPQRIARTPKAPPEIAGLLNLRGQIVTALDLRTQFGLPPRGGDVRPMNIVVRHADEWFSLLVDEVGDVIDVSGLSLDPVPSSLVIGRKGVLQGVYRLDDGLLVVLDIAAVLDRKRS